MEFPAWRLPNTPAAARAVDRIALVQLRWPVVIVVGALASAWLVYYDIAGPVRAVVTLGFLLICPGMAYIPLLRLKQPAYAVILAVALSLALDLLAATAVLYGGWWSPSLILGILIVLSLIGAFGQVVVWYNSQRKRD